MDETQWLADRFEAHRSHLRSVAYRMLGSPSEADDAVQEAWIRLSRAGAGEVENLGGWLTTVVSRVCLDMLRSRNARREEPFDPPAHETGPDDGAGPDPEREAVLADSVGPALLVVLETLAPAERLAFVLHDMFAVPFDEIGAIVGPLPRRRPPAGQPGPAPGPGGDGRRPGRPGPPAGRGRRLPGRLPPGRLRRAAGPARSRRRPPGRRDGGRHRQHRRRGPGRDGGGRDVRRPGPGGATGADRRHRRSWCGRRAAGPGRSSTSPSPAAGSWPSSSSSIRRTSAQLDVVLLDD